MTEQELKEIEARANASETEDAWFGLIEKDIPNLIAEVRRLHLEVERTGDDYARVRDRYDAVKIENALLKQFLVAINHLRMFEVWYDAKRAP